MGNRNTVLLYNGVLDSSINIGLFNRVMDVVTRCSAIETIASRKMPTVKAVMEDPNNVQYGYSIVYDLSGVPEVPFSRVKSSEAV